MLYQSVNILQRTCEPRDFAPRTHHFCRVRKAVGFVTTKTFSNDDALSQFSFRIYFVEFDENKVAKMHVLKAFSILLLSNVVGAFVPVRPSFGVNNGAHFMSAVAEAPTDASTGTVVENIRYDF